MYFILLGGDEPERVATGVVSWDYFQTLGVTPLLGRTFRSEDDGHDAPRRSCSATRYWQRAFGGRPGRRRAGGRDERSPAHDRRRAPGRADVPAAERRLHAAVGVSVPHESGRSRTAGRRDGLGDRTAAPGQSLAQAEADLGEGRAQPADRISLSLSGRPRSRARGQPTAARIHATVRIDAPHPGEHGRFRAPHRLRERRQPGRRADDAARSRAGAAHGARRQPGAAAATARDREPDPLARRRARAGCCSPLSAWTCSSQYAGRFTPRATEVRIDTTVLLFTLGVSLLTGIMAAILPAISRPQDGRPADPGEERRAERKQQHAGVDADRGGARVNRPAYCTSRSRRQRRVTARAAGERDDQALGDQLSQQARAIGAERRAHRQLALTPQGPPERQVRDVRARDEEHEHGRAAQCEELSGVA